VGKYAADVLSLMTHLSRIGHFVLAILFPSLLAAQVSTGPADAVLLHGRIYTVDSHHSWAQALAIRNGKILAVGTDREIKRFIRDGMTKIIDAKGRLVFPGFTDCHVHFMDASLALTQPSLDDAKTIAEVQQRIKKYASEHPDEPWILGRGWTYPLFPPDGLPNKKLLDDVVPDRPVYLESYDGHSWWANSKALEAAHITRDTPNPPTGIIVRDSAGEPTGAIKEDAADAIVRRAIPEPSRETKLQALRAGIKLANQYGLTRVHVLGDPNPAYDDLHNAALYEELLRNGELTLRLYLAYRLDPPEVTKQQLEEIVAARDRYNDEWITAGSVKFFMDGVIETHTAAMLAPYSNESSIRGELFWQPEKYDEAVAELDRRGIQIFTHAIGDRAIRATLDAYERAAKLNGTRDERHRIEHIEDPSAEDIPRFGRLGVIASMQPLHAYPDDDTLKSWLPAVGTERAQQSWPWKSIESNGGVLAFGSDWPIVTLNPWPGVQNAVTRETTEGEPKGGWIPSERISVKDAIRGYTLNAAFAGHREKMEGSLEAGKMADLVIVSQNVFEVDPHKIGETKVVLTMVGGRVVYDQQNH